LPFPLHSPWSYCTSFLWVAAEFELASAELFEALLVVAADLGPPLLDQELVEERPDLLLLGEGKVSDLVDQEVKLHGWVSFERRSLGTAERL
jgi:hypothetical protein